MTGSAEGTSMLGAIAGDIIGSIHEFSCTKTKDFPLLKPQSQFTDDTVLTVAVADSLLHGRDYVDAFHEYFHAYPDRPVINSSRPKPNSCAWVPRACHRQAAI
jgi:ADP-ribosylglycohydrolase